jgi:hypothetical protein
VRRAPAGGRKNGIALWITCTAALSSCLEPELRTIPAEDNPPRALMVNRTTAVPRALTEGLPTEDIRAIDCLLKPIQTCLPTFSLYASLMWHRLARTFCGSRCKGLISPRMMIHQSTFDWCSPRRAKSPNGQASFRRGQPFGLMARLRRTNRFIQRVQSIMCRTG